MTRLADIERESSAPTSRPSRRATRPGEARVREGERGRGSSLEGVGTALRGGGISENVTVRKVSPASASSASSCSMARPSPRSSGAPPRAPRQAVLPEPARGKAARIKEKRDLHVGAGPCPVMRPRSGPRKSGLGQGPPALVSTRGWPPRGTCGGRSDRISARRQATLGLRDSKVPSALQRDRLAVSSGTAPLRRHAPPRAGSSTG
jgi:hypothetical protein